MFPERVRTKRVRGHARPALPVGGVLRAVARARWHGAHVELQLRCGLRAGEGPVLLLRSAQLQGTPLVNLFFEVSKSVYGKRMRVHIVFFYIR